MNLPDKSTFFQNKTIFEVAGCAMLSIVFLWILLPFGPGISNDSLLYLECGDHLFSGKGFTVIGQNGNLAFASDRFPLYPILLKSFSTFGIKPLIFQALLFSFFSFLVMKVLVSFSPSRNPFQYSTLAFLGLLFPFILVFYNLWTEGAFLLLLLLVIRVYHSGRNTSTLLFLLTLLSLTRMVGITVGLAVAASWIFRKEYFKALSAVFFSVIPVALWAAAGFYFGHENSRQLSVHWISTFQLQQFFTTLGSPFAVGNSWQTILGVLLFMIPGILSTRFFFNIQSDHRPIHFLIVLFYVYPLFLFSSISFLDSSTPLDNRILAPQFLLLVLIASYFLLKNTTTSKIKMAPLFLLPVFSFAIHFQDYSNLHENGYGFNSKESQKFRFNEVIDTLSKETTWYSNMIHGVYYQTGKIAHELPLKFEIHNNRPGPDYDATWQRMLSEIKNTSSTIIWIRSGAFEKSYIGYEELKKTEGLSVIYDDWLCLVMRGKNGSTH